MAEKIGDGYLEIEGRPNRSQIRKAAESAGDKSGKSFGKKFTSSLSQVLRTSLGAVLKTAMFSAIGAAITGLAAGAGSFVIQLLAVLPALGSIASLAALIPGAILGAVAAMSILKVAVQGVGEALSAAFGEDVTAFNEAIKNLSPSAQQFAKSVQSIVKPLKEVQKGLQESFFSAGLVQAVVDVDDALIALTPNLKLVASLFGGLAADVVKFTTQTASVKTLNGVLYALSLFVASLRANFTLLAVGIRDVVNATLPLLTDVGVAIGGIIGKFGQWLSSISKSGQLLAWIDEAVAVLTVLGQIFANLGLIISDVLNAAEIASGNVLGTFGQLIATVALFTGSAEGMNILVSVFQSIMAIANALMPAITALVGVLISALAPAIQQLALVLGPVLLDTVNTLAPAIAPLVGAFAALVTAIAPFLPIIAQLAAQVSGALISAFAILLPSLTAVLNVLARLAGPVIGLLSTGLNAVLTALLPVITALIVGLEPILTELITAFITLLVAVTPVWNMIGKMLLQAVVTLLPVIANLVTAFATQLVPALITLAPIMMQIFTAFVPLIPLFGQVAIALLPVAVLLMKLAADILTQLLPALLPLILAFANFAVTVLTTLIPALLPLIEAAVRLASVISSALLPIMIPIIAAMARLGTVIITVLGAAFSFMINNIVGPIIGAIVSFNSRISDAINAIGNFALRVRSAISSAYDAIVGTFSNSGSLLLNAGRNIVNGLIDGITSRLGALRSTVGNMVSNVRNMLPFSPAKEGPLSGKGNPYYSGQSIVKLIADGMRSQATVLTDSVASAVQSITPTALTQNVLLPTGASSDTAPAVTGTPSGGRASSDEPKRSGNTYVLTVNAIDPRSAAASVMDAIAAWERGNGAGWRTG